MIYADAIYQRLLHGIDPNSESGFDTHVLACIFSLAITEAQEAGTSLSARTGLNSNQLAIVTAAYFPHALIDVGSEVAVEPSPDEICLVDLLTQCTTDGSALQARLALMIGRRAQSPNHLWQDLGLRYRSDLSRLMARHFWPLSIRNSNDMKWKKFLYRMICRDAGYALCTAPSCSECCDFEACFGDETGESRLARVRLAQDLGAA